ncbi:putative O-methyltransferase [Xylariaceae sp. FL0255]|nr:putative O-methyltransferase [Xylariaceae sp. FL0255]
MAHEASESTLRTENLDKISQTLHSIATEGENFLKDTEGGSREKLTTLARDLLNATQTPFESLLWTIWRPAQIVAARVAVDLKLFETVVKDNGSPKDAEQLAAAVGASSALVKRIVRVCVSMNMLDEQGPGQYIPNDFTRLLAIPEYASGIVFSFDRTQPSFPQLPAYLRETEFANPMDTSIFHHATKVPVFQWFNEHPDVFKAFHDYLDILRIHRPSWLDMYPVDNLVKNLKPDGDSSVFIDLGGGVGKYLREFGKSAPHYEGKLILQDIPEVIDAARATGVGDDDSRIELQVHDFFTPQPVRGARAYFLHAVLHDWSDNKCQMILGYLKDAMEPGYSKVLISDCVVANENAAWQHASLDIFMMDISGQERTEQEWYTLIESCGLKIAKIYTKGKGNESVIEVIKE